MGSEAGEAAGGGVPGQFGACSQRRSPWAVLLGAVQVSRGHSDGSVERELDRELSGNSRISLRLFLSSGKKR